MQDYDGPPPYHPLVGEGAWPDHYVNMAAFLILIAALIVCYFAYRAGQRGERGRYEGERSHAPAIIYAEVRRKIDIALMATGERIFAPARVVMETMEQYLGPVLALSTGAGANYIALRKALTSTTRKVEAHHEAPPPHHNTPGQVYFITPAAPSGGLTASSAAASGSASASVSGPAGGVQVMQPALAHSIAHSESHAETEVEITARDQARAVRESLEALADYWQKDRVESALKAAQASLLITRPIGPPGALSPAARLSPPPRDLRAAPPRPERPRRALF